MNILLARLLVVALMGLLGAIAIGVFAPDAATLILGIVALGLGLILMILFYLLRPVPNIRGFAELDQLPPLSTAHVIGYTGTTAQLINLASARQHRP